jgi:hypothetical protein
MDSNHISIATSKYTAVLAMLAGLLIVAGISTQSAMHLTGRPEIMRAVRFFDLDGEQNLPAFFSQGLLLIAALLLSVVASLKAKTADPQRSKWMLLAIGFLALAYDEICSVHERFIEPTRAILGWEQPGYFTFAWVIPGIVLVAVVGVFFSKFLWQLPVKTRREFCVAASLYLGGAIGIELLAGRFVELHGVDTLAYSSLVALEEGLEMAGVIFFIRALLGYLAENHGAIQFQICGDRERSTSVERHRPLLDSLTIP